jgi:putative polyhydroxyalkanoate system protein
MAQAITINIPHQLSRAEAKRRIQEEVARAEPQLASFGATTRQTWAGDTLDFSVSAAGQVVSGKAFVEDRQVRVEVALPWFLAALAGTVRGAIEQRGRQALGHRPDAPSSR